MREHLRRVVSSVFEGLLVRAYVNAVLVNLGQRIEIDLNVGLLRPLLQLFLEVRNIYAAGLIEK